MLMIVTGSVNGCVAGIDRRKAGNRLFIPDGRSGSARQSDDAGKDLNDGVAIEQSRGLNRPVGALKQDVGIEPRDLGTRRWKLGNGDV